MKKIFLFLIIVGGILFFMPKLLIFADVTTKMLGTMFWAVAGLIACSVLLYKFQRYCDEAVQQMREQKKRELAKKNIEIVYPTVRSVMKVLAYCLPRLFGAILIGVGAYLALSFAWYLILPVLKYFAYAAGVCFAVLLVVCAMTTKSDLIDDAA